MKNSALIASLLFGAFAVAAPFDKRALVYKTEVVTEYVVVYTTVYDDESVPEATATPEGLFYEQPKVSSSAVVVPTSTPAPKVEPSSSAYVAPPPAPPAPTPTPEAAPAPTPEQPKEEPKPTTTAEPYVAPAPTPEPAAAAPSPAPVVAPAPQVDSKPATSDSSTTGEKHSNVDITIYDNNGGYGACGTKLYDTDMIVALAQPAWGASTYDTMTGAATNPWCGKKIRVFYGDNHVDATIMDLCPGCSGFDVDLSLAAWTELTKTSEKTRYKASWSLIE